MGTARQVRKSALGRLLKPLFNLDEVEFPTESLLSPLRQGANQVLAPSKYGEATRSGVECRLISLACAQEADNGKSYHVRIFDSLAASKLVTRYL